METWRPWRLCYVDSCVEFSERVVFVLWNGGVFGLDIIRVLLGAWIWRLGYIYTCASTFVILFYHTSIIISDTI